MATPLSKIKILELNTSLGYAGAQRTMVSFCKYFKTEFFQPVVAAYGEGGPRELDLQKLGIPYVVAHGQIQAVVEFANTHAVDLVHIHRSGHFIPFEFELLKALKQARPNLVIIETNVFGFFDAKADALIDCHLLKSKMMLNERFVPASGQPFNFKRARVLYNPVDADYFAQFTLTPAAIAEYKASLGIAPTDFVIGRFGRGDIAKWSDLLIDMLPQAIRLIPNLKFIVQTAPDSRLARLKKFGQTVIVLPDTGVEAEVHRFYQTIDVLAHSSKIGEAFGNTLNEAMYWQKPVVVNSTPRKDNGQLEQIDHLKTGLIANHSTTYATALAYFWSHPTESREYGERGRHKVTTEYNAVSTTRYLEKIFVEQLQDRGVPISSEITAWCAKANSFPTESDILEYNQSYRQRLQIEFGGLGVADYIWLALIWPRTIYRKVRDFVEHRFGF